MKTLLSLLTLCLTGALLAGCGADDLDPDAVAEAARKTASAKGAHVVVDARMTLPGQGEVPFRMEGETDLAGRRAHFHFDLSSMMPEGQEGLDPEDVRGEQIMDGTTLYMTMPLLARELPGDKTWMKIDLAEAAQSTGLDFGQLQQMGSMSPGDQLEMLRAMGDLEEVGPRHYKGVVDLQRYAEEAPADQREELRRFIDRVYGDASTEVPVEVWLDERGYVTREKMTMEMPVQPGETAEMTMDMRFSKLGEPVRISVPPASEVQDMTELARQGLEEEQRR